MRISVMGTGYLGAVHAACMAHLGHEVCAYDVDASKIERLSAGTSPFYEPGFEDLLAAALATGRLRLTHDAQEAISGATVHFVCVGKSTVPVGTAQRLASELAAVSSPHALDLAWNPEFLREGEAIEGTLNPDRLIFGVTSEYAEKALLEVYGRLIDQGIPHLTTDLPTAEMVKVAANSFLATKISFINAMAEVCELVDADVVTLGRALGYDDRIGRRFLNAGLGFGGGCLPKDIRAFSARAGELGASDSLRFLHEVDKINIRRREKTVSVASALLGGDFLGRNIAVLGAAFKPNSDDVRDSPALNVAAAMHLKGANVRVHDPKAIANAKAMFPTLTYCESAEEACRNADLIVLATEWDEYRRIDPAQLRSIVRAPRLLDTRNAIDREYWTNGGWQVYALGRGRLTLDKDTNHHG